MGSGETSLTTRIKRAISKLDGVYVVKIHVSSFQQAGIPDLFCCVNGRLVCLEVKTATGTVSRLQEHEHARLRAAGAIVAVVRSVEEALAACNLALPEVSQVLKLTEGSLCE